MRMASIHPFRPLRPSPAHAAAVSSVPYDAVTTEEARQMVAGNPLSFLRVTRSEVDLPPGTDPYDARVYDRARENLAALREQGALVVDEVAALYLYRLRLGGHEQTGVAGCFSLDEYDADLIKKHERTRRDKEDDRTRHIVETRAQTGVVFLTYRAAAGIDAVASQASAGEPVYDFTAADGVQHTVWRAGFDQTRALVEAFGHVPALYIADGHHRAASAARARTEVGDSTEALAAGADTFIAVAFPDAQMQILPYNRTVKDLGGRTPEAFLDEVRQRVPVSPGPASPAKQGDVSMYVGGRWYTVAIGSAAAADGSRASGLDVARLQHAVLEPVLGIGDIRSDKRIDFVGGARGTKALEEAVDSGRAAVAFSMFPVTITDLIAISDAGGIMPPKSTWFEPKLRDGLLVHLI